MTFELHNESWLQVFQVEKWLSIRGNFMLQWTFLFVILGICQGCCKTSYNAQTVPTAKNSVQFSCWVISDSLWPHGPQHARPPCPSPTPGVYPNSKVIRHEVEKLWSKAVKKEHPSTRWTWSQGSWSVQNDGNGWCRENKLKAYDKFLIFESEASNIISIGVGSYQSSFKVGIRKAS